MKLHSLILFILALGLSVSSASAKPQDEDYGRYKEEVLKFKHEYIAKELGLSKEQQRKFFVLYDQKDEEVDKVMKEARDAEREIIKKGDKATDAELEQATQTLFNLQTRIGAIELNYLPKFKEILTKQQLFKLKGAERKFTNELVKYYRKQRHGKKE